MGGAGGVDVEQLRRHLEELLLHPRLAQREGLAAEAIEPDGLRGGAGELLDLAELRDRQVEAVGAVVGEDEEVALDPADLHLREPEVAGDPVLDVDDEVALVELAEPRREGVLLARLARAAPNPAPEDLLVRDDREPRVAVDEPRRELARDEVDVDGGVEQGHRQRERARVRAGVLAPVLEEPLQPVRRGGRPAGDHRRDPALAPLLEAPRERRERALLAVRRLDLAAQPGGVDEREADRLGGPWPGFAGLNMCGGKPPPWPGFAGLNMCGGEPHPVARDGRSRGEHRERLRGGEKVGRRRERELLPAGRRLVLAEELRVEVVERLLYARDVVDVHDGAAREVIEERPEPTRVEPGEERLHPEEGRPLLDRVEHLAHPGGRPVDALRRLADGRLRGLLALRGEERLAGRAEEDLRDVGVAPLGLRVEGAAALDLVAEELEPDRRRVRGRPQIDDPAAHREGPGVLDERHPREPEQDELLRERLARDLDAGPEEVGALLEDPARHLAAREAARRHDHEGGPLRRDVQPREGGETLQLDAAVGGEVVVGEHRVRGDAQHRARPEKEGRVAGELIGVLLVDRHREHRAAAPLPGREQLRDEPAAGGPDEAGHVGARARRERAADAGPRRGGLDL